MFHKGYTEFHRLKYYTELSQYDALRSTELISCVFVAKLNATKALRL